jgi:type IV pilus assembly protein PilE
MKHIEAGFTLIEVMIVVAIIAILSAIAMPSYNEYIIRGRIPDAVSTLSDTRVKMEQYFQDNRTYVGACATGTVAPAPSATPNFSFACSDQTASAYLITATGTTGRMASFTYTIDQAGARATTAVPAGWTAAANCWVIRKDGSC